MAEESLKEMLLNIKPGDYGKIMNHHITKGDILDFCALYSEFASKERDYQGVILGRSEAAQELVTRLNLLEEMSELIARGMKSQKSHYESSAKKEKSPNIEDQHKVLEVLRQLASNDSVQYEIKTITYPAYDSSERHGYRTTEEYTGKIAILAEKDSLSRLDSSQKLPYLTREMLTEVYQQGYSMVLFGNDEKKTERLDLPNKQTLGHYHPVVFYLQDDELAKATSSFISFIEENGADLEGIPVNDLVQAIKSKYQPAKRMEFKKIDENQ